MFGIFDPVGVGLLVIGIVVGVIGLFLKDRRVGWTMTAIGFTLMYIVL